jgi:hypothetical protein
MIVSAYLAVTNLRRTLRFVDLLVFACIGIALSSFLSWGVNSGISVWFSFLILLGYIWESFSEKKNDLDWTLLFSWILGLIAAILAGVNYLTPLMGGFMSSSEKVQVSNADHLKGLSARGSFISNMDNMLIYTENNIPKNEKVIVISGEDPFYASTQRINPLRFGQVGVNTYPDELIVPDIIESNAKWLIIKNTMQLNQHRIMPAVDTKIILDNLLDYYNCIEKIEGYDICVRR